MTHSEPNIPIHTILEMVPMLNRQLEVHGLKLTWSSALKQETPKKSISLRPMPSTSSTPTSPSTPTARILKAVKAHAVNGTVDKTTVRKAVKMNPRSFGQNLRQLARIGAVRVDGELIALKK